MTMTSNTEDAHRLWEKDPELNSAQNELEQANAGHAYADDESSQSRKRGLLSSLFGNLLKLLVLIAMLAVVWLVARNVKAVKPYSSLVEHKAQLVWGVLTTDNNPIEMKKDVPDVASLTAGDAAAVRARPGGMFTSVKPFIVAESGNHIFRTFTGTLKATQASDLGFNRIGTITSVQVDQGDRVKKGDVLAQLDTKQLNADIAILKAQRKVAEAKLSELVAGPRKQKIASVRSSLKEQETLRDQAKLNSDRQVRLLRENATARQDADNARKAYEAAQNRVDSAKQTLGELLAGTRSEQLAAQEALIEQLDANVDSVKVKIAESQLVAPFDGMISVRNVDDGAIVLPGAVVLRLIESKQPEAWVGLPANLVASLTADRTFTLESDSRKWAAEFASALPELDQMTRTQTAIFKIKADVAEGSTSSFPPLGQIVRLEVPVNSNSDGLWIPRSALVQSDEGTWAVFEIEPVEGDSERLTVARKNVSVERVDSDRVLVAGDISIGDSIVAKGVHRLTPGQNVRLADVAVKKVDVEVSTVNAAQ